MKVTIPSCRDALACYVQTCRDVRQSGVSEFGCKISQVIHLLEQWDLKGFAVS